MAPLKNKVRDGIKNKNNEDFYRQEILTMWTCGNKCKKPIKIIIHNLISYLYKRIMRCNVRGPLTN